MKGVNDMKMFSFLRKGDYIPVHVYQHGVWNAEKRVHEEKLLHVTPCIVQDPNKGLGYCITVKRDMYDRAWILHNEGNGIFSITI